MARIPFLGTRFRGFSRARRVALGVSAVWAVVVTAYGVGFLSVAAEGQGRGTTFIDAMFFLLALTMPLILVWLAALLSEELDRQRAMVGAIAEAIVPLAQALEARGPGAGASGGVSREVIERAVQAAVSGLRPPDLGRPIDRLIIGQSRIEASLQRLMNTPRAGGFAEAPAAQVAPAPVVTMPAAAEVETPVEAPAAEEGAEVSTRPSWAELIRALDFPRDAEDHAGFRALKAALRYPSLAQLLQAAEDVLNLLSQEGIYVDELPMDPVDPAAWRRFMDGVRGPEVSAVGGIREPEAIETAQRLMATDSIFRDSALFFQRRFDGVLADFGEGASDAALVEFAGTRSGRAFMLLARLNGSLD